MTRLLVHVEGQTEESFVNQVLAPHLYDCKFSSVSARLIGNARQRYQRGGIRAWTSVRRDIVNHLKEDPECVVTTMVDFYGLPDTGPGAWPGRLEASNFEFPKNAETVESAISTDIYKEIESDSDKEHFIPYVMMHEFEAMLFSDCDKFAKGIGYPRLASTFQGIRNKFGCPEEIDDSPMTAPSKRIESLVLGYQKPLMGVLASLEIGLTAIRSACPHFRSWLEHLERIPRGKDA